MSYERGKQNGTNFLTEMPKLSCYIYNTPFSIISRAGILILTHVLISRNNVVKCVPALKTLWHRNYWDSFLWWVSQKYLTGRNNEWNFQEAVKYPDSALMLVFSYFIRSECWPFLLFLITSYYRPSLFNVSEN